MQMQADSIWRNRIYNLKILTTMEGKEKITASWAKIMEDGASAAEYYMSRAIESIDKKFGEGYAEKHPELIGAFMKASAKEAQGNYVSKSLQLCTEDIVSELEVISDYYLDLKVQKYK